MKKIISLLVVAFLITSCTQQKTGFVNTEDLIKDYKEMSDAQQRFQKENDEIISSLELRAQAFQIKVEQYQKNGSSMSNAKRQEKESELIAERNELQQEQQGRTQKLQLESQRVIDSIITKVKKYVKTYGKNNGYTYIYGQNEAGSVLYGKEELDLTEAILKDLNDQYKAGQE
ncbi:OmpH family outer membrane protein [Croceiramulus getboli]|nr:OmpH family outer membrane protein [Flavobacteriaceae bacterium YJPT1-3]